MNNGHDPRIRILRQPAPGLLCRVCFGALGLVVLVAAFFFVGLALATGAVFAAILALRWWWLRRKLARELRTGTVEGEYRVIEAVVSDRRPDRAGE
jgi:predicted membrane metal-binding protein